MKLILIFVALSFLSILFTSIFDVKLQGFPVWIASVVAFLLSVGWAFYDVYRKNYKRNG